jgi:hypothetical protein
VRQRAVRLSTDTAIVVLAAGALFLAALLLGVWKYRQMATSPTHLAHPYVDIAHRAALLYSFATLLIATFVQLSDFGSAANLSAALVMIAFFYSTLIIDVIHVRRDTTNQFADPLPGTAAYMAALTIGQIGGWLLLLAGFVHGRWF